MIEKETPDGNNASMGGSILDARAKTDAAYRLISGAENNARAAKTLRLKTARIEIHQSTDGGASGRGRPVRPTEAGLTDGGDSRLRLPATPPQLWSSQRKPPQ